MANTQAVFYECTFAPDNALLVSDDASVRLKRCRFDRNSADVAPFTDSLVYTDLTASTLTRGSDLSGDTCSGDILPL